MTTEPEVEVERFEYDWDDDYRRVTVTATFGVNSDLEISEQYDPAIEDVDKVIVRCTDDLRLLIRRRGH